MRSRFQVGQSVRPANPQVNNPDTYLVLQVLPETSYEPQYRIKGVSSGVECVVCETQITSNQSISVIAMSSPRRVDKESSAQVVWC
jgi:hypothetical protein